MNTIHSAYNYKYIGVYHNSMVHIIYTKNDCKYCDDIKQLVTERSIKDINFIDANNAHESIPAVPMLVTVNGQRLIGADAFKFVNGIGSNMYTRLITNVLFVMIIIILINITNQLLL